MNATELKAVIENLLKNHIGKYDFNGVTVPAIFLGSSPYSAKKQGLEVVISRAPKSVRPQLGYIERKWNIVLIQHPGLQQSIETAIDLFSKLPCTENITFIPQIDLNTLNIAIPDQCIVTLSDNTIKLTVNNYF